jgi:hypothetical protein
LNLQSTAAHVEVATTLAEGVHAALKCIILPAEEVVAVLAVSSTTNII